jgi:ATP-dependent helicase HrpA
MKNDACDVLKLYGRMDSRQQEAIFASSRRRKIICATNIAETSVTVPNIRFVVDSGLARSVRFDPAAGITRMPVERISRASADQRAGRCGRVREGICIRLYTQADYASMPRFTSPEIKRSNLAGVILRLAYLGFGKPRQFPFLQQPTPAALDAGYRQLRFLGALDRRGALTRVGRAMAVLPLDPAVARMLLYAQENGAFSEVAIIASALSVGDMRAEAAPAAGKRFEDGGSAARAQTPKGFASDFMELVAVWRGLPWNRKGGISRRRLSEFCETYGFSLQRVKEWVGVHRQLVGICRRLGDVAPEGRASYEAVHKSLLSALAGDIAEAGEGGAYCTARMRDIRISPGSRLFRSAHDWVLLHDIAETKRPYARYAAAIRTSWIQDLFPGECRTEYEDPHYDPEQGTVVCLRQVTFNGLRITKNSRADYAAVRPDEAHAVFIREALVEGKAFPEYDFQRKNRAVAEAIERAQRKLRDRSLFRGAEALFDFYSERLAGVAGAAHLAGRIGRAKGETFLLAREGDLLDAPLPAGLDCFPDSIEVAGRTLALSYAFEPGSDRDGATVDVPLDLYKSVPLHFWEWLLPVFWKERIAEIVRMMGVGEAGAETALFSESDPRVEEAIGSLVPGKGAFLDQALPSAARIFGHAGTFEPRSFAALPSHLWLRLRIVDDNAAEIETLRPPFDFRHFSQPIPRIGKRPPLWAPWCSRWERDDIAFWNGERALIAVSVASPGQPVPVRGLTGLCREDGAVCLRVFLAEGAAWRSHRGALRQLLERELSDKVAWAWRDFLKNFRIPFRLREGMDALKVGDCLELIFSEIVFQLDHELPPDSGAFARLRDAAVERIAVAGPQAVAIMTAVIPEYEACLRLLEKLTASRRLSAPQMERMKTIGRLVSDYAEMLMNPSGKLSRLRHLSRYLRGCYHRMQMAAEKPMHYGECERTLDEFRSAALAIRGLHDAGLPDIARRLDEFEEMIEEFALALFGHGQIGTRFPVSEQRLRKKMDELHESVAESNKAL